MHVLESGKENIINGNVAGKSCLAGIVADDLYEALIQTESKRCEEPMLSVDV